MGLKRFIDYFKAQLQTARTGKILKIQSAFILILLSNLTKSFCYLIHTTPGNE